MAKIKLTFDKRSGEARVEAEGFVGPACQQATEFLIGALGTMTDFREKEEWFQTNLELSGCVDSNLCG